MKDFIKNNWKTLVGFGVGAAAGTGTTIGIKAIVNKIRTKKQENPEVNPDDYTEYEEIPEKES